MGASMVSYGILYPTENSWIFPPISYSLGICGKTHATGRACQVDSHTFPKILWVLFYQISILWYALSHGKCMSFPINFSQHGKTQQSPSYGGDLRYPYTIKSYIQIPLHRGVVVTTTPQFYLSNPNFRFCAGLNLTRGVSEIYDGEKMILFSMKKLLTRQNNQYV